MFTAVARLAELERRWSRFLADSELSILNTAEGAWVTVSQDTRILIATMQQASVLTDGSYDPTFLHELLETGYTESLDDPTRMSIVIDLPCPGLSVHDVIVDEAGSAVRLPHGLALDPGGIGKGLAADLIVGELLASGTRGALVSIGGDMCAAGCPPTDGTWQVDVADPREGDGAASRLTLNGGGVATSSTLARRSLRRGEWQHHTIDPATRRISTTDLASATVVAGTGWQAEAHATAVLIAGSERVEAYSRSQHVTVVAILHDGSVVRSSNLETGGCPSAMSVELVT